MLPCTYTFLLRILIAQIGLLILQTYFHCGFVFIFSVLFNNTRIVQDRNDPGSELIPSPGMILNRPRNDPHFSTLTPEKNVPGLLPCLLASTFCFHVLDHRVIMSMSGAHFAVDFSVITKDNTRQEIQSILVQPQTNRYGKLAPHGSATFTQRNLRRTSYNILKAKAMLQWYLLTYMQVYKSC